jgi:hypothetical protein
MFELADSTRLQQDLCNFLHAFVVQFRALLVAKMTSAVHGGPLGGVVKGEYRYDAKSHGKTLEQETSQYRSKVPCDNKESDQQLFDQCLQKSLVLNRVSKLQLIGQRSVERLIQWFQVILLTRPSKKYGLSDMFNC